MKVLNAKPFPTAISFGRRADDTAFLAVIVKGTFELRNVPAPARWSKGQLPILTQDEPFDPKEPAGLLRFESDLVPFKPRTDVVLVGQAYAPYGRPTKTLDVDIEVGALRRKLLVVGDRLWSFSSQAADGIPYIVGPADFVEMPLTYNRAFGGIDKTGSQRGVQKPWCELNLLGRGFAAERSVDSIDKVPLPNIEDPNDRIRTWDSRPRPLGCGFLPRSSRPRSDWFGTFDEKWKRERAPKLPTDFRFDAYNGADPNFQVSPWLQGNELVALSNVAPGGGRLQFQLPCLRPVVTLMPKLPRQPLGTPKPKGTTAEANLDTLVFCPEASVFYVVWRATFAVGSEELTEVDNARIEYLSLPPEDPNAAGAR